MRADDTNSHHGRIHPSMLAGEVASLMSADPLSVSPDQAIADVAHLMGKKRIGSVLVTEAGVLVGIFTERDLLRLFAENRSPDLERPIREKMTEDPIAVSPETSKEDALFTMTENMIRHLPVVEEDRIVGILSLRDFIDNQEDDVMLF